MTRRKFIASSRTRLVSDAVFSECVVLMRSAMPSDKQIRSMRSFHRQSTTEEFVMSPESPLPDVPSGGARVKVLLSRLNALYLYMS